MFGRPINCYCHKESKLGNNLYLQISITFDKINSNDGGDTNKYE